MNVNAFIVDSDLQISGLDRYGMYRLATHWPFRPSLGIGTVGGLLLMICCIECVRHRGGNGSVGHTKHRLLKSDTDLHVDIGLSMCVVGIPIIHLVSDGMASCSKKASRV